MTDFVRENLLGKILQPKFFDLAQADHHGMVEQPDHRETSGQLLMFLFHDCETPRRLVKLNKVAPQCQRLGPDRLPLLLQEFQV